MGVLAGGLHAVVQQVDQQRCQKLLIPVHIGLRPVLVLEAQILHLRLNPDGNTSHIYNLVQPHKLLLHLFGLDHQKPHDLFHQGVEPARLRQNIIHGFLPAFSCAVVGLQHVRIADNGGERRFYLVDKVVYGKFIVSDIVLNGLAHHVKIGRQLV